MSDWKYIVRFEGNDGKIYYARLDEPLIPEDALSGHSTFEAAQAGGLGNTVSVRKVNKSVLYILDSISVNEPIGNDIPQLLSPAPRENEIVCIGTNYAEHAKEAGLKVPTDPVMWYKPKRSLADPGDISIPKSIQDQFIDFEGELTIVTSKDAKEVSVEDAEDCILGYVIGNDLTARLFQDPARAGGQFTRAKAFDNFAPVGPFLANQKLFGGLEGKRVKTTVNGKVMQNSALDLIHEPAKLVSFLSIGTTLPAGTLIMTGTPPGVGWFQEPKSSLKDGDVVEVEITSLGKLSNTIRFD